MAGDSVAETDPGESHDSIAAGAELGAYHLVRKIGTGGMGTVWLAQHAKLGRPAAIKVLHPELSYRTDIVERFFNEARAATAIRDPGIVQVFDFGNHSDGRAYIVMELLEGDPLDQRLERNGALGLSEALRLMRQLASTLGAAHAAGIIHRDLKPENIFVVRDPEVPGGERAKVLDFGIAKLAGEVDVKRQKTKTTAVMGTPTYMSPEQCRGAGQVDHRADVYSLGCVLCALLTGRPPFEAEGGGEVIAMHLTQQPQPPSLRRPGLPPEVDELVLTCLAKDPALRFQTAGELAMAIGRLLGASQPSIPPPATAVAQDGRAPVGYMEATTGVTVMPAPGKHTPKPTTLSSASASAPSLATRRGRGPLIAGLAGVVVAGGVIAGVELKHHSGGDAPAPVAPPPPPAVVATQPAAPAPTPAPDPSAAAAPVIKATLTQFVAWSHSHPGAACPDAAALGAAPDPWGHPLRITCTDQPGNQIAGVVSDGPDGIANNADDISSWLLGADVASIAAGPRWVVVVAAAHPVTSTATSAGSRGHHDRSGDHAHPTSTTPTAPAPTPKTNAVQLDDNGLPIAR